VGIFDRLGDVIKSYLNQEDERIFGPSRESRSQGAWRSRGGNPDLEEAEAELENFLRGGTENLGRGNSNGGGSTGYNSGRTAGNSAGTAGGPQSGQSRAEGAGGPPEGLRRDFAELGVPFGAGPGECRAAYKRLLKLHHPDRHARHEGNLKKATEKSARINGAYERIAAWRAGNKDR
jgi:DnaJ-domain-containing protein 1